MELIDVVLDIFKIKWQKIEQIWIDIDRVGCLFISRGEWVACPVCALGCS